MLRNFIIAVLTVASLLFVYQYQGLRKTTDQQAQLLLEMRDRAERELQSLRDKLAAEERARQIVEKDAKAVSAKLAEEQTAHDAAAQSAKAANERLTQVQAALDNAKAALDQAQKDRDQALQTLAKERSQAAGQSKPAG